MMENNTIVTALHHLVGQYKEGLAVQELQPLLYAHYKLKLSYHEIEDILLRNAVLFSETDRKYMIKTVK